MTISYKKGFTLVETLVAISILLMVIIGPMTVAQKGIQLAYYATEQATAVYFAQEAIEQVRIARDNRALEAFKNPGTRTTWVVGTGGSGDETINNVLFDRVVTVDEYGSSNAKVTVTVSWNGKALGTSREVVLQTWLYDHYKRYE